MKKYIYLFIDETGQRIRKEVITAASKELADKKATSLLDMWNASFCEWQYIGEEG